MASSYGGTEVDTVHSGGPQKQTVKQRVTDFLTFVYNIDEGTCLGRTALSWAKIGLFYLIFYSCLAGFFTAMIAVFYQTIDWDYPKLQGESTLLKANPGLGFRPIPDVSTTLIRFVKGKPSTYRVYTDHIQAFLLFYEKEGQQSDKVMDCSTITGFREQKDWESVCPFDLSVEMGQEHDCIKENDFGYDDGQPCIILKLNKLYGWMPRAYKDNQTAPKPVQHLFNTNPNYVFVNCEGEDWLNLMEQLGHMVAYAKRIQDVNMQVTRSKNPSDKENIGEMQYIPPQGFHFKFYPYLNQQGYRQPLMFVQFRNITNGIVVMVNCKAYADNIYHERSELAGMIHFEVMVD